jgi:hypothetical protein
MIDPGIWDSVQAMSLTPAQFKLYIFLISAADDEGRLKLNSALMRSRAYPFNDYTQEQFDADLAKLEEISLVLPYTVDGADYLCHPNWTRYQKINRPTPSLCPPCDSLSNHGALTEDSLLVEENRKEVSIDSAAMSAHAPEKKQYADSVLLSEPEWEKLVAKFGEPVARQLVDTLSSAKLAKGYKYKSDYHAILTWVVEKCKAVPVAVRERVRAGPGWKCPHCGKWNSQTGSVCFGCHRDRDEGEV